MSTLLEIWQDYWWIIVMIVLVGPGISFTKKKKKED